MSRADKKLEKWLNNTPTDERLDAVKGILNRFFPDKHSQNGTSHFVVQDDRLKGIPGYGPEGDFTVVIKGGQKVKGNYLKRLAKTINLLKEIK